MKPFLKKASCERGAALITVLLIVSVMSAGIVLALDTLGYAAKRTVSSKLYEQAKLYALGGEEMARIAAEKLFDTDQAIKALLGTGDEAYVSYPLNNGGSIKGFLKDTSNCFNLNSVVTSKSRGTYVASEQGITQYQRLLVTLGFSEAQSNQLANTLVDWIDSDSRPSRGGAEDYDYSGYKQPYRASNSLLSDITELRLVKGYTAGVLGALEPYVCALDTTDLTLLNVNSLRVEHAAILKALVGDVLNIGNAQRIIAERPARGYNDVGVFWQSQEFDNITIEQSVRAQATVWPVLFEADIHVEYEEAEVRLHSLIYMSNDGTSRLLSRQYGAMF